jgi:hypothetical protein
MRKILFFICSFLSFTCLAKTSTATTVFTYTVLNEQGVLERTLTVDEKALAQSTPTPEDSFKKLKLEKKSLTAEQERKLFPGALAPKTIAIIGDTGCRLKESIVRNSYQDCMDPKDWPFPQVMKSIAKEKPDVIIHLGDYHYREQCSPGKPCQKMTTAIGYGFSPWELDFFTPSVPAFKAAPWILVRGNHEDCKRAFLGYRQLLASQEWKKDCVDYEDPDLIVLGDLLVVNIDSSTVPEMPDPKPESTALWKERLDDLGKRIDQKVAASEKAKSKIRHIWLISHKPIYGLVALGKVFMPVNINLRKYFENTTWAKKIEVLMAGHIHTSELVRAKDFPLQIVLGNSGTALDVVPKKVTAENLSMINYEKAKIISHGFGYALLRKENSGNYSIEYHNADGTQVYSCHIKDRGQDCFKDGE